MIGLVLLYFVGKAFYDLARANGKGQWLFAILGVGSYYAGLFLGGLILAVGYELALDGSIDEVNDTLLGIMALPIGVLACWGFYRLLKSRWESKETFAGTTDDVLDANMVDRNTNNL